MLAQAAAPALKSDQVVGFVLLDLFIILVAARLVGAVFKRFKQPRVVDEITAGVLLGPTILGPTVFTWSNPPEFLHCPQPLGTSAIPSITSCLFPPRARSALGILGQLALTLFIVGLELNVGRTEGRRRGSPRWRWAWSRSPWPSAS